MDQEDPSVKIRASLAMLFFAFLTMIVCLQVLHCTIHFISVAVSVAFDSSLLVYLSA